MVSIKPQAREMMADAKEECGGPWEFICYLGSDLDQRRSSGRSRTAHT